MTLSDAQKRFLADFAREGYQLAPSGSRDAGRRAAAFWRTCEVLQRAGLVRRGASNDAVYLTWRGLAWTVAVLRGEA